MKIKRFIRRFLCWIGAAGMLLVLGGCSRTVSAAEFEPIPLDTAQMMETATQSQTSNAAPGTGEAGAVPADLYTRLGAPKTYAAELQSEKGYLKVHVDASLDLPNTELPVVRTQAHLFTSADAERIANVLLGSDAHYIDGTNPDGHFTKACLQREIDDLSDAIARWDTYGNVKYDLRYYTKSEAEDALSGLQAMQPSLPDAIPAVQPDFGQWDLVSASNDQGAVETSDSAQYHYAMPNDETVSRLMIQNCPELLGCCSFDYCRDLSKVYGAMQTNPEDTAGLLTISAEDAEAQARAVVDALGYPDFICVYRQACLSDNADFAYYRFFFLRLVENAQTIYWNSSTYADENFEMIQVGVDDGGILRVSYDQAQDVLGVMTSAAELLPFSQIQSVFEKMILVVNNSTESEVWNRDDSTKLTVDYYISNVRLGLSSVPESGDSNTRLLVPVWAFCGYSESRVNGDSPETLGTNGQSALLTINAIDGTVVDGLTEY